MSEKRFDPMTGQPINNPAQSVNNGGQSLVDPKQWVPGQQNQPQDQQNQPQGQQNQPQGQFQGQPQQWGAGQQNQPQGQFQGQPQQWMAGQQGAYGGQPFGGNNVPPKGNNKKMLIIGGIAAAVLILILVNVAIFMRSNKKNSDDTDISVAEASEVEIDNSTEEASEETDKSNDEATVEATEDKEEEKEADDSQKAVTHVDGDPGDLSSFTADGKTYTLPVKVRDLLDAGWEFENDNDGRKQLGSGQYDIVYMLWPNSEKAKLDMRVTNYSIDAKELIEGYVTEISFDEYSVEKSGADLSFHNGDIKLKESTKDDVIAALGDPDDEYDGSSSYAITYENNNDTSYYTEVRARFSFEKEDGRLSYVTLENTEEPSDLEAEEVSGEEPEYLSKYKAPDALGDDLLSGNISVGGKVYNLPVPLKVLMEDGWSFGGDETHTVGANQGYSITLAKGDARMYASTYNVTSTACYIKYTIVTEITIYGSSFNKLEYELPGGITQNSTQKDLDALLSSKGISNYDYKKTSGRYVIPLDQSSNDTFHRNKVEIVVDSDGGFSDVTVQNFGWLEE